VSNVEPYRVRFSKKAQQDVTKLTERQKWKLKQILQTILSGNPYQGKALKGKLKGLYSYRLNRKDRIVYEIYEQEREILIIRARSHYDE
jgi:Txe/YoeB family toxin of toxin-antitoxin system